MLTDQKLMQLSLTIAIIGIIALFFIVQSIEPRQVSISELSSSSVGEFVIISGKAGDVYNNGGTLFFSLSNDDRSIKVVMFQSSLEIEQGALIEVTGKVALYENELEIIASSIGVVNEI